MPKFFFSNARLEKAKKHYLQRTKYGQKLLENNQKLTYFAFIISEQNKDFL